MKELNFLGKLEMGLQLERLVIGIEEPVLVKDLGEINAKIDSGNGGYNVIHGEDITYQGNYITFLTYDGAGNQKRLNKKVIEELDVHIGGGIVQKRPVIELDIKFANENYKKIPFSVTDRTENTHRILISKDFVENTIEALIDVGAKNISNLNYDVDYKESVNEAKNELENMNFDDNPNAGKNPKNKKEKKVAYNPDGTKADWIDKMNDFANRWAPNASSQLTYKKDEEAIQSWPSNVFANYAEFYKKDQQNIQEKILMADEIKKALLEGDITNINIKDNKILGNRLRGISLFSYLLKKGDAGAEGKGGEVITSQEQRRELWYTHNNDAKKALEALRNKDKKEQKNQKKDNPNNQQNQNNNPNNTNPNPIDNQTNSGTNESYNYEGDLLNEKTGIIDKIFSGQTGGISDGGRGTGSRSFDAVDMKDGYSGTSEDKSITSDETLRSIKSEGEKILNLKGFIVYYIPFYNQDNSKELKTLNDRILEGSFDSDMSAFIEAGNGANIQGAEKVAIAIKKFVVSNPTLLEKLPGAFALCYSDNLEKDAPRNIRFLSKESVIASVRNEEDLLQKLKEMLGIPDELEETDENINAISSLLDENQKNSETNIIEKIRNLVNIPEPLDANDENVNNLIALLDSNNNQNGNNNISTKDGIIKILNNSLPSELELNNENLEKIMKMLNL